MKLPRRTLLAGLAGTAVACNNRPALTEFPVGVASHVFGPTSAVLWTRALTAEQLDVALWNAADDEATALTVQTTTKEGLAHAPVDGLTPATRYHFVFTTPDGVRSDVGTLKTQPDTDALVPVTLGATSCIKEKHDDSALADAATRGLDAFIFLGDTVYADAARTLPEYRREWLHGLAGDGYRALRGSTSLLSLWDDHEVHNDWEGSSVKPERLSFARQAFNEHQPGTPDGPLWRKVSWGRTVDLFVIDARSERNIDAGQYVSPEQLAWLIESVRSSTAVFKLVLNSVPIGSFDAPLFAFFARDNWQSCPAQRDELLTALEGTGAHFISGDFHFASVGRVSRSGPGATLTEFLVGPGANSPNPSPSYPTLPQWDFASGHSNYATFHCDPMTRVMTVRYHRGGGDVLFEATYPAP